VLLLDERPAGALVRRGFPWKLEMATPKKVRLSDGHGSRATVALGLKSISGALLLHVEYA
jgi:hypothetical protein